MTLSELPTTAPISLLFHKGDVSVQNHLSYCIEIGSEKTIACSNKIDTESWAWLKHRPRFMKLLRPNANTSNTSLRGTLLHYCRIEGGNFGDDLNLLLWKQLFPNLSELAGRVQFYGIGTLLDGRQDSSVKKVVLGTGIGELLQAQRDGNWDFRWVRGPRTAKEFGLPAESGLGDAAILWSELHSGHSSHGPVGLVPHYMTYDSFDWEQVAREVDMVVINPRQSPSEVIQQMRGCSRILAESLHGAICADAMGIPWAACVLAHRFNEFKWRDWLETIGRAYEPLVTDRPLVRRISTGKSWANHMARLVNYRANTRHPALRPVAPATAGDVQRVANKLNDFARNEDHFQCSAATTIAAQRGRMETCCVEQNKSVNNLFGDFPLKHGFKWSLLSK